METVYVKINDTDFECSGFFEDGVRGNHHVPDQPPTIELHQVRIADVDVLPYLSDWTINLLKERINDKI